jgi:hypothetical protein
MSLRPPSALIPVVAAGAIASAVVGIDGWTSTTWDVHGRPGHVVPAITGAEAEAAWNS